MKLHAVLICKKRLAELGWKTVLKHQDEQDEQTHWWLDSNIPYRTWSFYYGEGSQRNWWGSTYKEWKEAFSRKYHLVKFLKRYYKHYINFWIWEDLEDAIQYEDIHIFKALNRPSPTFFRR